MLLCSNTQEEVVYQEMQHEKELGVDNGTFNLSNTVND